MIGTRKGQKPKETHQRLLYTGFSVQADHVLAHDGILGRQIRTSFKARKVLEIWAKSGPKPWNMHIL